MDARRYEIKIAESKKEVLSAMKVREKVFQIEQGISRELDVDGKDKEAVHVIVRADKETIGTARARLLQNGRVIKIERMAVLPAFRKQGCGRLLLNYVLIMARMRQIPEVVLHAQVEVQRFYFNNGFFPEGGIFEEAGIPHVRMHLFVR